MLNAYLAATANLLQNPGAPNPLYSTANLTTYINTARGQLAGEAECIRALGTLSTVIGQQAYNFSSINTGVVGTTGVQGVINVRQMWYAIGSGKKWIKPRPWEWFGQYHLNNPVPANAVPTVWAQYGQGAAGTGTGSGASGSFYLDPIPDAIYALTLDCVCYPQALAVDGDVEAIPYLWTDAVPFYAAAYALWSSQNNARFADADRYYNHYTDYVKRAREASNPSQNRWMYSQAQDPAQAAKMQVKLGGGAGAA